MHPVSTTGLHVKGDLICFSIVFLSFSALYRFLCIESPESKNAESLCQWELLVPTEDTAGKKPSQPLIL